jgi:hypothetical protein
MTGKLETRELEEVDLVFFVEPLQLLFLACARQLRGYVPDSLLPALPNVCYDHLREGDRSVLPPTRAWMDW